MQKLERLKPYKCADPMETVHRIRQILHDNDIFVIETWQGKDTVTGTCSCRIILGDEGIRELNIGTNGKGMNARYALASAYAEFMERLQNSALIWAVEGVPSTLPGAVSVTKDEYKSLTKDLIELAYGKSDRSKRVAEQCVNSETSSMVIPFKEYQTGETVLFPVSLFNRMTGSNGMAAGNTVLEATIQGLSEIFERTVIHDLFHKKLTPPVIDEVVYENTEVLNRLKKLSERGINYKILDCSLGKGFPVIGLLLEKEQKYHVHFGADPSPITALERCLTEVFQGRTTENIPLYSPLQETEDRKVLFENHKKEISDGTGFVPVWIIEGEPSWKFEGFAHPVTISDEDDMDYYMEILSNIGKKLYIRENGFLGFPTVRLYVPGITESHCPEPEYCIDKEVPGDVKKLMQRLPILTDDEYQKLAFRVQEWLRNDFQIFSAEDFQDGHILNLKRIFPVGKFIGKSWDDRLMVAAIYFRGGLTELGTELLNKYIEEKNITSKASEMLKIRLRSRSLTFLPTEWPQCPDCSTCRAKHLCYQDKIDKLRIKLSN